MQAANEFFQIHISNVIELGALGLAYLGYRKKSKKEAEDRESVRQTQALLHQENTLKLNSILEFNRQQAEINKQRDTQVTLLSLQTTQLTEIAKGLDRRVTMIENR